MHYYSYFVVCCFKLLVVLCRNTNRIRNNVVEMIEEKNNPKKLKKKKVHARLWSGSLRFCSAKLKEMSFLMLFPIHIQVDTSTLCGLWELMFSYSGLFSDTITLSALCLITR